jgi:tetratricopeptide (TPR) repeat protein
MADVEKAIQVERKAIDAIPNNHPDRPIRLNDLGNWLGIRYSKKGAIDDLEAAIQFAREAVNATPESPNRVLYLNNLAAGLGDRYLRFGEISDLDEAIQVAQEVVNATLNGDSYHAIYRNNLASRLLDRFSRTGSTANLNEAIQNLREAVDATADDDDKHYIWSNNLSVGLGDRYDRLGEMTDLEEAIQIGQKVVNATRDNNSERARRLNNLANQLGRRYRGIGAMADLEEAIQLAQEAVDKTLDEHPDRVTYLNNLEIQLGDKYVRTGLIDNLDKAIQVGREVIKVTPDNHLQRRGRLNNLAIRLRDRYLKTGVMDDLEESVQLVREAVDKTAKNDPDRALWLHNLGIPLGNKYSRTRAMADLQEAINVTQEAVAAIPDDHLDRAAYLNNHGDRLGDRYSRTGAMADLKAIVSSHQSALRQSSSTIIDRILGGKRVLGYSAITSEWQKAYEDSTIAINLIPRLTPRALDNSDKQHMLGQIVGLASDATAAALHAEKAPLVALNLLEQGRGILATSLEEMRTDILGLQSKHPELAKEFLRLRDVLDGPVTQSMSLADENGKSSSRNYSSKRSTAGHDFDNLIIEIRKRPGFEDFLLPPNEDEIKTAGRCGPIVVINVSEHRCDALLVEKNQIRSLALTNLKGKEIEERAQRGGRGNLKVLAWLWDAVTKPILDTLGFTQPPSDDNWPHVWWIPTGKLSKFPLHAAGLHGQGSTETVLDRVMSSYSSSIKAIIQGRQRRILEGASTNPAQALLVNMTYTPDNDPLSSATKEVDIVQGLCNSISYKSIMPIRRKQDIMSHLPNCKIFHFAGHGSTDNADPSKSSLLLEDWKKDPLTVANLLELNLREHSPFLAYLSACGTGEIRDEKFFDENIHLISACQLAGFRHVIGTLWEVHDKSCLYMAKTTYEEIIHGGMTDESVCLGLHKATRGLRDNWLRDPTEFRHRKDLARKRESGMVEEGMAGIRDEGDSRLPRKATVYDSDEEENVLLHWVPYVHFGV